MSELIDDGRKWWRCTGTLWMGVHTYAAPNARAAVAAYRRDLTEAEVSCGRSRRETVHWLRLAQLHVVDGPWTTPEAYELDLGWELAFELTRWTDLEPVGPAPLELAQERLGEDKVAAIATQVRKRFEVAHD